MKLPPLLRKEGSLENSARRQNGANYHVLNTIALYDNFVPSGKTGLTHYERSRWCTRSQVVDAFANLIEKARFGYIFLSYSNRRIAEHR